MSGMVSSTVDEWPLEEVIHIVNQLGILKPLYQGHQEIPEIPARRLIPLLQDPTDPFQLLESL